MANIHIIIGEDDYLVAETAKKIIGDGVGLEIVDSLNSSNAELQLADIREADASLMTRPFLDPKKVTWWRNVVFLPGASGKKALAEDVKVALEKFARRLAEARLPDNQHFILSAPRLLMTSIFAKTLAGVAEMAVFESGKPWQMKKSAVARMIEAARGMDLAFAPGAAEAFVDRVGTDSRSLMSELEKMRGYIGSGHTITAADVAAISSPGVGVEPVIFELTDAIAERNRSSALAALKRFELESGFAVIVSGALERMFRQMLELKDAKGAEAREIASAGMSPWTVKKMLNSLGRWTLRELRLARYRFLALRERAVSSSGEIDSLVTIEVLRTIGGGR